MPAAPLVRARGVVKHYREVVALDGVDLDVPAGQVHGLVGPNGAGKTTLLGLLLGLAAPDSGELEVVGRRLGRALSVPAGVAGFVDGPALYPTLTAAQNLTAVQRLRGVRGDVADVLERVGLSDVAGDRVAGFSLGMRQRLGLAAALLTRPRLLVLDEPANGLDPAGTRLAHRVVTDLVADGASVVLSSHRMDDLTALCAEVTILDVGRVVFSGSLDKLAAETGALDYRVVTSDPVAARRLCAEVRDLRVVADADRARVEDPYAVVVRGAVDTVDDLVRRLVLAGVAVRELAPVVSPLEAAFLSLTGSRDGASS